MPPRPPISLKIFALSLCWWAVVTHSLLAATPSSPIASAPPARQARHILHALALETAGNYSQAEQAWLLSQAQGPTAEQHLFALRLLQGKEVAPQTPLQQRLAAQYLHWRNDQAGLKRLFAEANAAGNKDPMLRLLQAESLLQQGEWAKAEALLPPAATDPWKQESQLLRYWLLLLQGKDAEAQTWWNKLDEESLLQEAGKQDLERSHPSLALLSRAWLLHPQEPYYRERLQARLLQEATPASPAVSASLGWRFPLPPLKKGELPKLRRFLQRQGPPPAYDLWLRHLQSQGQWEAMAALAQDYAEKFPALQDGRFYLQAAERRLAPANP